jgi:tellurite resistance protein TehA-like permease
MAHALFGLSLVAYAVISVLVLSRFCAFPRALAEDLGTHARGPGFLTAVAATSLIGAGLHDFTTWQTTAAALWLFAIALWLGLGYGFVALVTIRNRKTKLESGLSGAWLLLCVAPQSLAVLGTSVASSLSRPDIVIFSSLAFHLVGTMLYVMVIVLVFERWTFAGMTPAALSPTYWINGGAAAITVLAGARLFATGAEPASSLSHFLAASNLLFWAVATWWMVLLVLAFIWRHAVRRMRLAYDVAWWSMVFPVGMYVACTDAYARTARLDFLAPVPRVLIYVAWACWLAVAGGLAATILRTLLGLPPSPGDPAIVDSRTESADNARESPGADP